MFVPLFTKFLICANMWVYLLSGKNADWNKVLRIKH